MDVSALASARNNATSFSSSILFRALKDDGFSKADVARELFLPPSELNKLIFGLDSHLTLV